MNDIIKKGIQKSPKHGFDAQFYEWQYIADKVEWEEQLDKLFGISRAMQDEFYPDRFNGGNAGPFGGLDICEDETGEYVYVYSVGSRGEYISERFALKKNIE